LKEKDINLAHLNSADEIAQEVNQMFQCDLVSGRGISDTVANGDVGKSPPKQGCPYRIDDETMKDIAMLHFTAQTIDQVNGVSDRLRRTECASVIGSIVNEKLKRNNEPELNDQQFYKRIMKEKALNTAVKKPDKRELLRIRWLTYERQKKHYEGWEKMLVDKKFARLPTNDEEREEFGHVVFLQYALSRMFHCDEMGFSFDGSKNGVGGRQGTVESNGDIPDGGEEVAKSSQKVSILAAATYDNEPFPLLIVIPSVATIPRCNLRMLQNLHQVEGKFGYKEKRQFNCLIGKKELLFSFSN